MPIAGVEQPEILEVTPELRLRKYDGNHAFALSWYQDPETVWLVDGVTAPYDVAKLNRMYTYLNAHGELYFIECLEDGAFRPIGDVTFWQEDMPIVLGDRACRGKGIGRKVVCALAERGRALGYAFLLVDEIYAYNLGSQRMFESVGFRRYAETEKGYRYRLELK